VKQRGEWMVAASRIYVAENPPIASGAYTLPSNTLDQRWDRMQLHWINLLGAHVAYAKSKGEDLRSVGHSIGKLYAAGWSQSPTPFDLVRGYYTNAQAWKDVRAEMMSADESSAVLKITRPWAIDAALIPTAYAYAISGEEVDTILGIVYEEIANSRGLSFEQHRDGDKLIVSARRK